MAKLILSLVLFIGISSQALAAPSNVSVSTSSFGQIYAPGDIMFQDEFDTFNKNVWHYEINMGGGGNNEFQIYNTLPENAWVANGRMYIKPAWSVEAMFGGNWEQLYNGYLKLEGCTDPPGSACERQANYPNILPPVVSARLRTKGSFSFTYGRVEARAKLPSGDWMWPAIWMLPENWVYGGWPYSGEIDIMESRGNRQLYAPGGQHIGSELAGSTLHFGPGWPHNGWWAAHGEKNTPSGQGYDRDFHIYELEWTPSYIRFRIDGTQIKSVDPPAGGFFELGQFPGNVPNPWVNAKNFRMAPFDEDFHILLNVATGGGYFPGDSSPRPPWGGNPFLDFMSARDDFRGTWNGDDAAMQIDYIRVYAV
ncbi:unnamed protein product [Allacma fusca]|uniref:GH16 domain-containing protein n=1 Tax=Allacma fusca TaxID=39272 RepID=A0A8J2JY16_9HEXA|nr:unnamed protein product [Allacma fusca]